MLGLQDWVRYKGLRVASAEATSRCTILLQGGGLTIPILNFSEHSCVFPADSP
jgi:hypothetical protein